MNHTVVTRGEPAGYRYSDIPTFTRDVDTLSEGHRLENENTSCAVGHQDTVACEMNGERALVVAALYAILWWSAEKFCRGNHIGSRGRG